MATSTASANIITNEDVSKSSPSVLQAWVSVIFTAMFFFYWLNQNALNGTLADYYIAKYHLTGVIPYSTFTSMYLIGNVIMFIPAGIILDKFSTKRVLTVNIIVMLIGVLGLLQVNSAVPAVCCMLLIGFGGASALIAVMRIVANWFRMEKSGFPIAIAITLGMLGGTFGSSVFSLLRNATSGHTVQVCNLGLGVLILLGVLLFVKDKPQGGPINKSDGKTSELSIAASFGKVLCTPQNWLAGLYTSLLNFPIMVLVFSIGPKYIVSVHGEHLRSQAHMIMSALLIGTMIGGPVLGKLTDKMKSRKPLMIVCAALATLIMLPMYFKGLHGELLIAVFFVMGLITSAQNLGYPVIGESNDESLVATAMSLGSILIMGGGAVAQNIAGVLLKLQDYQAAYTLLPVCCFIAMLLAIVLKEKRGQQPD
ncbi:MFS transporter [Lentisphaerota bacterium ZTH]|nr:MFS transporter [Lentisphaerota bacterium]WET05632.1 MFS transporter [Lentisphaerota bacterium ZTH]